MPSIFQELCLIDYISIYYKSIYSFRLYMLKEFILVLHSFAGSKVFIDRLLFGAQKYVCFAVV